MRNQEFRFDTGPVVKLEVCVFAALLRGGEKKEYSAKISQSLARI